ncbi:hypothetical protein MOQ72_21125 [Saccharopolyspora sp. K220]|nr:hypothetical protein [Saccharopolyspora soli]MCI2419953.1 hypothetical protein [Saccharopolyspora soli]
MTTVDEPDRMLLAWRRPAGSWLVGRSVRSPEAPAAATSLVFNAWTE